MIINIDVDNKPIKDFSKRVNNFDKSLTNALAYAMLYAEGESKQSFGKHGNLKVRTGRLRNSIQSGASGNVGWIGTNVIYACIYGGRTKVTTKEGLKNISAVKVGDKVLTQTGEFKHVLNTFKFPAVEKPNLIKITTEWRRDRKHSVIVTDDHKILVFRDGRNKWVKAGEILLTDKLFDIKKVAHNKGQHIKIKCINCGKVVPGHTKKQFLCSRKCKTEWWEKGNNPHIGMERTEENKKNMSEAQIKRYKENPKSHPNYVMAQKGYMTSTEKEIRDLLIGKNEVYKLQHKIGKYWVDFYLPERNLVIEADGAYWHQDQSKDIERDKAILKEIPGVKILHIHFYKKGYTPNIDTNPLDNVYYSVCNPNINSYVELNTFRTVDILSIEKITHKDSTTPHSSRQEMLYDLTIEGVHSFLAGGLLVSNSINEFGGIIKPKNSKYLKFQIMGKWKTVKQVVIPKRPFLFPAVNDNKEKIAKIIVDKLVEDLTK